MLVDIRGRSLIILRRCCCWLLCLCFDWRANGELKVRHARCKFAHRLEPRKIHVDHRHLAVEQVQKIGLVVFVGDDRSVKGCLGLRLKRIMVDTRQPLRCTSLSQSLFNLTEGRVANRRDFGVLLRDLYCRFANSASCLRRLSQGSVTEPSIM